MNFKMKIFDIFYLESGQTVFAVDIRDSFPNPIITSFIADLEVDGKIIQRLTIEGEFTMNAKHPKGYRAIFTTENITLTTSFVKKHNCYLRSIP